MKHLRLGLLLFSAFLGSGWAMAQGIFISRFVPGNYLADNQHLVEITNPGTSPVNVSGYFLVTRDYGARLPSGTIIAPGGVLRIVKRRSGTEVAGVELSKAADFLIRIRDRRTEGNYVALMDKSKKLVTGFYHSPLRTVPFLPEADTLITINREVFFIPIPEERDPLWGFLSSGDDPAVAFVKENGTWRYASVRSTKPTVDYRNVNLRYHDGVVTIKFTTASEQSAAFHLIERSLDQQNFEVIERVEAAGTSADIRQYTAYDAKAVKGKVYYYRIRNEDVANRESSSRIAEVKTEEGPVEFSLEVFTVSEGSGTGVNVRFFSQYSQKVKIKILDSQFREVAILFNDYVFAGSGNLLKISRSLPAGEYLVLADTETKRFSQVVAVR